VAKKRPQKESSEAAVFKKVIKEKS